VIVERWLQIATAVMVTLSAALLGFSQGNVLLPIIMLLVAVTAVVFTDHLHWFRLHRVLANGAMLIAAFFSLREFIEVDSQQKLLAIANLLVYVQIIMLYQEKKIRIYGHLIVFSLLQAVVGSLLSRRFEFVVILSLYMVAALFALSLLSVFRQLTGIDRLAKRSREPRGTADTTGGQKDPYSLLVARPLVRHDNSATEMGHQIVGWGYTRYLLGTSFGAICFAGIFFFVIPRSLDSSWHQPRLGSMRTVGFANKISLGQMGKVLKNKEVVMRVAFNDLETGLPYEVFGSPYFRGSALSIYQQSRRNPGQTGWLTQGTRFRWRGGLPDDDGRLPGRDRVQQDILYQLSRDPILMAVGPAFELEETSNVIRYDWLRRRLVHRDREEGLPREQFRYKVGTTAFQAGNQLTIHPVVFNDEDRKAIFYGELRFARQFPGHLVALKRLAGEILQSNRRSSDNRIGQVRELERYLRSEDRFIYSLDQARVRLKRDFNCDPVEDFLVNHRTGHCEYFASALALMCRSQGIPARVVVGYKGGEYNPTGQFYRVRQSDAHAWVEVFLAPDQLPEEQRSAYPVGLVGGWMRADPTIPREDEVIETLQRSLFDTISDSFDYMQLLWDNYVLHMGPEQQQKAVYDPLRIDASNSFSTHWSVTWLKKQGIDLRGRSPLHWFEWRGAVTVMLLIFALLVGYQLMLRMPYQWLFRKTVGRFSHWQQRRRGRVDFYERLQRLLRRYRWKRSPGQTQREFSDQVAAWLNTQPGKPVVGNLPRMITDAYYQVRFGGLEIALDHRNQIDQALQELEEALAQATKH
jgi:transglutaminase-like putative cysteine protease